MLDFFLLQLCLRAGGPLLDKSVNYGTSTSAPLARRLVEFFLNIGIRFGFHSFGIRSGMAGPVIANGFRRRREAGRRKGSIDLPRFWTGHWQSIDKQIKTRIEELKQIVFQSSERVRS